MYSLAEKFLGIGGDEDKRDAKFPVMEHREVVRCFNCMYELFPDPILPWQML